MSKQIYNDTEEKKPRSDFHEYIDFVKGKKNDIDLVKKVLSNYDGQIIVETDSMIYDNNVIAECLTDGLNNIKCSIEENIELIDTYYDDAEKIAKKKDQKEYDNQAYFRGN